MKLRIKNKQENHGTMWICKVKSKIEGGSMELHEFAE
jgi:hypothetical protein